MNSPNWQKQRDKSHKVRVRIAWSIILALLLLVPIVGLTLSHMIVFPASRATRPGHPTQTVVTVNPPAQPTASVSSPSSPRVARYISISGQNFVYSNVRIHPYGATMYPYWRYNGAAHRGGGWTNLAFKGYIDQIIMMAQQLHLNTLRPTNYFDGVSYGDWYNATVWSNMDYLFQQAARHNIYILLDLSSFRDKTLKQGMYPYNPSLYTAAFFWVAARYAHNPALLNYAIAGEVKCPTSNDPLRPISTQALTEYYQVLSDTLYKADPNHLISPGGLSYLNESGCGIDWRTIFSLPHINIAAIHVYSNNDRQITLPMVSQWAAGRHEPFTVEEFGFRQGDGDTTRASEFQNMYSLGKQYNATSMIFWNLGPEVASSSYEVNTNTPLTWNIIQQNAP
ncbi:MAG: cellulase family glycosylhydrolase [Ktedonobacteraceae bacterium]|nr:cellulase family glycosylhydrolase [Ktedonobacteraceae bacterium]